MKKKIKFRVNDIVLTSNNSLAIVDGLCSEQTDCSVILLCQDHTKDHKFYGKKWDYNAWHSPESLKLVARVKGLKQLIKLCTIAYQQKKL